MCRPSIFLFIIIVCLCSVTALSAQQIEQVAQEYILSRYSTFGSIASDLEDWILLDQNTSRNSGIGHTYFQQAIDGVPVYNAIINVTTDSRGQIAVVNSTFVSSLISRSYSVKILQSRDALQIALGAVDVDVQQQIISEQASGAADDKTIFKLAHLNDDVVAHLVYVDLGREGVILHWRVELYKTSPFEYWEVFIRADDGQVSFKRDQVVRCKVHEDGHNHDEALCKDHNDLKSIVVKTENKINYLPNEDSNPDSYLVYAMPVESPNHGGQTTVVNPADALASPYGWHDTDGAVGAEYTITRGNNVYSQEDQNGNNGFGSSPDGGAALDFIFPVNTSNAPSSYTDGALTNLFYFSNIIHDVFYQYGFDEAAGNFQENNYGRGGSGGDYVIADGQDGGGSNNANFSTPSDGSNPRMQMFLWTSGTPDRDGDLDNGIIAHEYGHGISNRLTGGRFASGCLNNTEQAGEGWSDFFGLVLTHEASDTRNTSRGIGTYASGEPINGVGIREYPYTTDMTVNPHTYDDIKTASVPHGVGSVMCATLWDMYWDMIDVYGYDSDIYTGTGGNNMAIQLVIDGLKMQPCSPGFLDVRDAIVAADELLYQGGNKCLIWAAFARRGMGYNASQGSNNSRSDGTEDFTLPPDQGLNSESDKTIASTGEVVTFVVSNSASCTDLTNVVVTDTVPPGMSYVANSASDGGTESDGIITWPTISSLAIGTGFSYTFQATMDLAYAEPSVVFTDDMESGGDNWSLANASNLNDWVLATSPANFAPGSIAWFAAEPAADPNVSENQYLTLSQTLSPSSSLQFSHRFDTEANWDGGIVEISEDGGLTWTNLGPHFIANGYNDFIRNNPSEMAFAGNSLGYQTSTVDLSSFCGDVMIRFNFFYDQFVAGNGWYVDDVEISSAVGAINKAQMSSNEGVSQFDTDCITVSSLVLPVEWVNVSAQGHEASKKISISWSTGAEINNKGFFIERLNNNNFIDIGWVDARATANSLRSYTFDDVDVHYNQQYTYRVRQVDYDGQSSYSNVVSARIDGNTNVKIYPNPLRSGADLFLTNLPANEENVHIDIIDQHGRTIRIMDVTGDTDVRLSTASFSSGVYIVRWYAGESIGVQRIIIY